MEEDGRFYSKNLAILARSNSQEQSSQISNKRMTVQRAQLTPEGRSILDKKFDLYIPKK